MNKPTLFFRYNELHKGRYLLQQFWQHPHGTECIYNEDGVSIRGMWKNIDVVKAESKNKNENTRHT